MIERCEDAVFHRSDDWHPHRDLAMVVVVRARTDQIYGGRIYDRRVARARIGCHSVGQSPRWRWETSLNGFERLLLGANWGFCRLPVGTPFSTAVVERLRMSVYGILIRSSLRFPSRLGFGKANLTWSTNPHLWQIQV